MPISATATAAIALPWTGRGEARERLDALIGVTLHTATPGAGRAQHGRGHGTRADGAVVEVLAAQQWRHEWHERARQQLERAHLGTPSDEHRGLKDVE